ncbi:MAG: hypothetical protein KKD11_06815, partial [Candidatus Omnitrophica bacterium]|nr:hypothetical protein [Candidatus Omnitrophota bacterium]
GHVDKYSYNFTRVGIEYDSLGLVAAYCQYGIGSESGTGASCKDARDSARLSYMTKKWEMLYNKNSELVSNRETSIKQYYKDDKRKKIKWGKERNGSKSDPMHTSYTRDPETGWLVATYTWGDWENDEAKGGGTYITYNDYNDEGVLVGRRQDDKGVWSKAKWTGKRIVESIVRTVLYSNPFFGWLVEGFKKWAIDGEDFSDAFNVKDLLKSYAFQVLGDITKELGDSISKGLGLGKPAAETASMAAKIGRAAVKIAVQVVATGFVMWAASGFKDNPFDSLESILAITLIVAVVNVLKNIISALSSKITDLKAGLAGEGTGQVPEGNIWQRLKANIVNDFTFKNTFTLKGIRAAFASAVFDTIAQIGTDMLSDKDSPDYLKPVYFLMAYVGNLTPEGTFTRPGMLAYTKMNYFATFVSIAADTYYAHKSMFKDWKEITTDKYGNERIGDVKIGYQIGRLMFKRGLGSLYVYTPPQMQSGQAQDDLINAYGEINMQESNGEINMQESKFAISLQQDGTIKRILEATGAKVGKIDIEIREKKDEKGHIVQRATIVRKAGTKGYDGILKIAVFSRADLTLLAIKAISSLPKGAWDKILSIVAINDMFSSVSINQGKDKMILQADKTKISIVLLSGDVLDNKNKLIGTVSDKVKRSLNNLRNNLSSGAGARIAYERVSVKDLDRMKKKLDSDKIELIKKKIGAVESRSESGIASVGIFYNDLSDSAMGLEFYGEDGELVGRVTGAASFSVNSVKPGKNFRQELEKQVEDFLSSSAVEISDPEKRFIEGLVRKSEMFEIADKEIYLYGGTARDAGGNRYIIQLHAARNVKGDKLLSLEGLKHRYDISDGKIKLVSTDIIKFEKLEKAKSFLKEESAKAEEIEAKKFSKKFDNNKKDEEEAIEALLGDDLGNIAGNLKEKLKEYFKEAIGRGNLGSAIVMLYKKAMEKIASKKGLTKEEKQKLETNLKNNVVALVKKTIKANLAQNPKIARQAFDQIISTIQSEKLQGNEDTADFLQNVLAGVFGLEPSGLTDGKFSKIFKVTEFSENLGFDLIGISKEKITKGNVEFFAGTYFSLKKEEGEVKIDKPLPGAMGVDKATGDIVRVTDDKGHLENLTKEEKTVEKSTYPVDTKRRKFEKGPMQAFSGSPTSINDAKARLLVNVLKGIMPEELKDITFNNVEKIEKTMGGFEITIEQEKTTITLEGREKEKEVIVYGPDGESNKVQVEGLYEACKEIIKDNPNGVIYTRPAGTGAFLNMEQFRGLYDGIEAKIDTTSPPGTQMASVGTSDVGDLLNAPEDIALALAKGDTSQDIKGIIYRAVSDAEEFAVICYAIFDIKDKDQKATAIQTLIDILHAVTTADIETIGSRPCLSPDQVNLALDTLPAAQDTRFEEIKQKWYEFRLEQVLFPPIELKGDNLFFKGTKGSIVYDGKDIEVEYGKPVVIEVEVKGEVVIGNYKLKEGTNYIEISHGGENLEYRVSGQKTECSLTGELDFKIDERDIKVKLDEPLGRGQSRIVNIDGEKWAISFTEDGSTGLIKLDEYIAAVNNLDPKYSKKYLSEGGAEAWTDSNLLGNIEAYTKTVILRNYNEVILKQETDW